MNKSNNIQFNGYGLQHVKLTDKKTYKEWVIKPEKVSGNMKYPCFPYFK